MLKLAFCYTAARSFLGSETGGCSTMGVFLMSCIHLSYREDWRKGWSHPHGRVSKILKVNSQLRLSRGQTTDETLALCYRVATLLML